MGMSRAEKRAAARSIKAAGNVQTSSNGVSLARTASEATPVAAAAPVAAAVAVPATRARQFPDTAKIVIATENSANPKRPGTKAYTAWKAYFDKDGKLVASVKEFGENLKKSGFPARYTQAALRWDSQHGFIKIEG